MLAAGFPVLQRHNVPFYSFNSGSAGRLLHYLTINVDSPTCVEPEPFIEVPPDNSAQRIAVLEATKMVLVPMHETVHWARGVISNTVADMEQQTVNRAKDHPDMAGVAVYCVGPLFQADAKPDAQHDSQSTEGEVLWFCCTQILPVCFNPKHSNRSIDLRV